MRRLPILLLLALAACAGPRDASGSRRLDDAALADSASGAGSWGALCAGQKAACEVLG